MKGNLFETCDGKAFGISLINEYLWFVMTIENKKLDLIQWVTSLSDEHIISKLYALKQGSDVDWYDELTTDQKKAIEKSITQADSGSTIPHNEVRKRIKTKIQQLKNS